MDLGEEEQTNKADTEKETSVTSATSENKRLNNC